MARAALLLFALVSLGSAPAIAHEVRPGYLELRESEPGLLAGRLRQPIVPGPNGSIAGLDLKVVFPTGCARQGDSRYERADGYLTEHFVVHCASGLDEGEILVDGLTRTLTDIYVTFVAADGRSSSRLLNAVEPGFQPAVPAQRVSLDFLWAGMDHMLGGLDHVLFVLGLMLLVASFRRLVFVITAFTVAHSITLGLAVLDLVRLPGPPVEAAIALSIVFLAYELTRAPEVAPSTARRHPEAVAFAFGLLHGFGFAGALAVLGLPAEAVLAALFLFNVGVEIAQLIVVAFFGLGLLLLRRMAPVWSDTGRAAITGMLGVGAIYFFALSAANLT